jgi:hypothetical protein
MPICRIELPNGIPISVKWPLTPAFHSRTANGDSRAILLDFVCNHLFDMFESVESTAEFGDETSQ